MGKEEVIDLTGDDQIHVTACNSYPDGVVKLTSNRFRKGSPGDSMSMDDILEDVLKWPISFTHVIDSDDQSHHSFVVLRGRTLDLG